MADSSMPYLPKFVLTRQLLVWNIPDTLRYRVKHTRPSWIDTSGYIGQKKIVVHTNTRIKAIILELFSKLF